MGLMTPRQHPALRAVSFSTHVAQPHRPELLRVPAPRPGGHAGVCWGPRWGLLPLLPQLFPLFSSG